MTGIDDAAIVSLACARFEDALAEEQVDDRARAHLMTCERCAALYDDLVADDGLIAAVAAATGPREVPAGFADAVLRRALGADADLLIAAGASAAPPRASRSRWLGGAAALAVAAAALFVVVGGPRPSAERPIRAVVEPPEGGAAARARVQDPGRSTSEALAARPVPVMLRPSAPAASAPGPIPAPPHPADPVVPAPAQVPEHALNIPGELEAALLQHIKALDGCPARSDGELRVTLTLDTRGAISNRQVLSSAGQSAAHQCLNQALDKLLLPPLDRAATVTIDLSW